MLYCCVDIPLFYFTQRTVCWLTRAETRNRLRQSLHVLQPLSSYFLFVDYPVSWYTLHYTWPATHTPPYTHTHTRTPPPTHTHITTPPYLTHIVIAACIDIWHEDEKLHLDEPVDRVILYFHVRPSSQCLVLYSATKVKYRFI